MLARTSSLLLSRSDRVGLEFAPVNLCHVLLESSRPLLPSLSLNQPGEILLPLGTPAMFRDILSCHSRCEEDPLTSGRYRARMLLHSPQ